MWKLTPAILAAAAAASLAAAQTYNTSAPFTLSLTGADNATINGQFLEAAHAGAAIEVLALAGTDGTPTDYNTYNLNVTADYSGEALATGNLVWTLHGADADESEALLFIPTVTSNVLVPEFQPGSSYQYVGFDDEDKLFLYSGYYDESTFVAGTYPTQVAPVPLYHVSASSPEPCTAEAALPVRRKW